MKKETKMAPVFEMEDTGRMDQNGKIYYLYMDGVRDNAEYTYSKKENDYWCQTYDNRGAFCKKILNIKSEDFPDNLNLFIEIPQSKFYKDFGLNGHLIISGMKGALLWWISFEDDDATQLYDQDDYFLFIEEFGKTVSKNKFNITKPDSYYSFECIIPHRPNESVTESFFRFQNQVNLALYETDKRMTDNLKKKILKYEKTIVKPAIR